MDEVSLYTSELILCERMSGVNGQERKSLSESFSVCRFSLGPFQTTPPLPPFFTSIKPKFPRKISRSRLKVWESMPETNDEEKKKKKRRKLKKKKKEKRFHNIFRICSNTEHKTFLSKGFSILQKIEIRKCDRTINCTKKKRKK